MGFFGNRIGQRACTLFGGAVIAALLSSCAHERTEPANAGDEAAALHDRILVLDGHADIVLPSTSAQYLAADGKSKVDIAKLEGGGVGAVIMSVAVPPGPRTPAGDATARAEANEKLAAVQALVAQNAGIVVLATSAAELQAAHAGGRIALMLGLQNARLLEGDVAALDEFYAEGVRVFAFNHIGHNDFADSSRPFYDGETRAYEPDEEHGGLSMLGEAAVDRINALGGVIDISQSSKAASLEIIKRSQTPVIASHSNVRALSDVSRNLSDEEIDLIGAKGGLINVAAFGAYLVDLSDPELLERIIAVRRTAGLPDAYAYPYELYWEIADKTEQRTFLLAMRDVIGPGTVARMVDHIDYIAGWIGTAHVGIATDFNHGGGIDGFVDATEARNVTAALLARGYSAEDVEKIWSGNFLRVLADAENAAAKSGD